MTSGQAFLMEITFETISNSTSTQLQFYLIQNLLIEEKCYLYERKSYCISTAQTYLLGGKVRVWILNAYKTFRENSHLIPNMVSGHLIQLKIF